MSNRIVFLSRLPLLKMFTKTLGIDYFIKCGFDVFFLDCSNLIDGNNGKHLYQKQEPVSGCDNIIIRNLEEFKKFVKYNSIDSVFIDYISGLSEYDINTGRIFKILKEYKSKYYIVSDGAIPRAHHDNNNINFYCFFLKIKKIIKTPSILYKFVLRKFIVKLVKYSIIYQKPHRIFGIQDSPELLSYIKKYGISKHSIIPINSRDYDLYTEYLAKTEKIIDETNICIFLDEDHTNHPDYLIFNIQPLDKAEYISSMNNFFYWFEKITNLSVVIAGHPKSRFSTECHPYGDRIFIKGATVELVAKSKMVISHSSTSVSFPVLFNKPIFLVVTEEMKNRMSMISSIKAFAKELGLSPLYVDSTIGFTGFDFDFKTNSKYNNYMHKYVKNKDPINKITWEIVADAARND